MSVGVLLLEISTFLVLIDCDVLLRLTRAVSNAFTGAEYVEIVRAEQYDEQGCP